MCKDCGCGEPDNFHVEQTHHHHDVEHDPHHQHNHHHPHHGHGHHDGNTQQLTQSILAFNDSLAGQNRQYFEKHGVLAVNVVSSPGSGKTTLLGSSIDYLRSHGASVVVIVGDLATNNDARRLTREGVRTVQITTGTTCHLDAHMITHALEGITFQRGDILLIENVGNLVCPASFDLGEAKRVVLFSVTEGEEKPLKYPPIFAHADAVVISKTDLAEVVEFKRDEALDNVRKIARDALLFEVSAKTGAGIEKWCQYLMSLRPL
jgi:hydrogenase nickel incorporation protein HypB